MTRKHTANTTNSTFARQVYQCVALAHARLDERNIPPAGPRLSWDDWKAQHPPTTPPTTKEACRAR